MNRQTAIQVLKAWDEMGRCVFTLHDLTKLFPGDSPKALREGLARMVQCGLLQRACRGIYVFSLASGLDSHTIERVATALRRGEYNYISLESALSEYGAISQIPMDCLTVMTTGRKGLYRTPWGSIEFTHTKRPVDDILEHIRDVGRPLRMATPWAAWRDLKRVGRNTHLVDPGVLSDV